jgi:hypothetical protein
MKIAHVRHGKFTAKSGEDTLEESLRRGHEDDALLGKYL